MTFHRRNRLRSAGGAARRVTDLARFEPAMSGENHEPKPRLAAPCGNRLRTAVVDREPKRRKARLDRRFPLPEQVILVVEQWKAEAAGSRRGAREMSFFARR